MIINSIFCSAYHRKSDQSDNLFGQSNNIDRKILEIYIIANLSAHDEALNI